MPVRVFCVYRGCDVIEIKDPVKTARLSLTMTRSEKRKVERVAREFDVSMSEVVRRAVRHYCETQKGARYGQAV